MPVVSAAASAQSPGPLDDARASLASGGTLRAFETVQTAIRGGDDAPDLLRLRLRLELAGAALGTDHLEVARQGLRWAAHVLQERAPGDTLALRVLADDAVWRVLDTHDRVRPAWLRGEFTEWISRGEEAAMMRKSRFDTRMRNAIAPDQDMTRRAREAHEQAIESIEPWLATDPTSARAYDDLAILAVATQNADALAAVARRYAATRSPRADLYLGLAQHLQGDDAAAERTHFEDIGGLLPTDHQAAYAAAPDSAANAFWAATDDRLLTPVHGRRVEHVARVVEAGLLFGRYEWDTAFSLAPSRGAETPPGRIWVRYGRPPLKNPLERDTGDGHANVWEYPDFRSLFNNAFGPYSLYTPDATVFSGRRGDNTTADDDYVTQDRVLRRDDPQRTQDLPGIALDVPVLVSRFRAPDGTDAAVAFAVPTEAAGPAQTGVYSLANGAVTRRVMAEYPPGRTTSAATLRLAVAGAVRVEVEAPGDARGEVNREVAPLAPSFGVSDLLLAIDDEGRGPVVRDGLGIVPAARAVFAVTDPVYVVLEAYGLGPEDGLSRYTVEATLTPAPRRDGLLGRVFEPGQGPGVAVRTEAEGDRPDEVTSFYVDVRDQPPGAYTLRVEVADDTSGDSAFAERVVVLERERLTSTRFTPRP